MQLYFYYLLLFMSSCLSAIWVFKKVLKIAIEKNIVDNPDARKLQRVPVPVLGGLVVYFGIISALAVAGILKDMSSLFEMGCVMSILLLVGIIDDIISLSPKVRFFVQILTVIALIYSNGYSINHFHGLWGLTLIPNWIAVPLTVLACVGIINSINLIDGVNGLSSGFCIVSCFIFGYLFSYSSDIARASLAFICVGSLLPFFFHNVFGKKSKMFIGDGGTLLMGVILSSFVINTLKSDSLVAQSVSENFGLIPFTLAVFTIPVFDTLRVMTLRIMRKTSPFHPDKTHLHHLLLDLHFSHVGTTGIELLATILVITTWYFSYRLGASVDTQLYIVIFMGLLITFGFYRFSRVQERKQTNIYHWLTKVGNWTHVGHTNWFERFRDILDKGCEEK